MSCGITTTLMKLSSVAPQAVSRPRQTLGVAWQLAETRNLACGRLSEAHEDSAGKVLASRGEAYLCKSMHANVRVNAPEATLNLLGIAEMCLGLVILVGTRVRLCSYGR